MTTTGRPPCNRHRCLSPLLLSLQVCVFCRNNGESEAVYSSHMLKDAEGKICCPVLYIYTCPICGASGPDAHTIKYCPQNHGGDSCNVKALKTSRTSAGRRRYFQQWYRRTAPTGWTELGTGGVFNGLAWIPIRPWLNTVRGCVAGATYAAATNCWMNDCLPF